MPFVLGGEAVLQARLVADVNFFMHQQSKLVFFLSQIVHNFLNVRDYVEITKTFLPVFVPERIQSSGDVHSGEQNQRNNLK